MPRRKETNNNGAARYETEAIFSKNLAEEYGDSCCYENECYDYLPCLPPLLRHRARCHSRLLESRYRGSTYHC